MKLLFPLALLMLLAGTVCAQDAARVPAGNQPAAASPSDARYFMDRETATRMAIQQRAAWKAAQRQQRIEMYKWYGYSPARPPAATYPMMGSNLPWLGPVVYYQYPGTFLPRAGFLR